MSQRACALTAPGVQVRRKTKIICTAVPSTNRDTLRQLVGAGMDVLRINLSHSTTAQAEDMLAAYREAAAHAGALPCVLCELRGSTLRASYLMDRAAGTPVKHVELRAGQRVQLYGTAASGPLEFVGWADDTGARIGIQYEKLGEITPLGAVVRFVRMRLLNMGPWGEGVAADLNQWTLCGTQCHRGD